MAEKKEKAPIPTVDDDEQEEDTIKFPDPCTKYKFAAEIVNNVMKAIIEKCVPGKSVLELCTLGDNMLNEQTAASYKGKKFDKGIAFPTCVSVNNCVGNFSPLESEAPVILAEGDVCKISMGAHIDGFVASGAHTHICTANAEAKFEGRKADVYCAAYQAFEAALRLLKPGKKNSDVTTAIGLVADAYKCFPVEGHASYSLRRCIIQGSKVILNKALPPDQKERPEVFEFAENEVYCLDVIISTGEGRAREGEAKTTVFKRAVDNNYQLKGQTSRKILSEIHKKCPYMPFSLRSLEDEKKSRMGITELVSHDLVQSYPVTFEKSGELVAQFKSTVLITTKQTDRLNAWNPSHVTSAYSITNPEVLALLASGLKRASKNKKKKKAAQAVGGAAPAEGDKAKEEAPAAMDVDKK